MNKDKQTEEMPKITKIYEPIDITNEMRSLVAEMSKAISTEYEKRVLADERKLEAVLKENGWRKASEVASEIFDDIKKCRVVGVYGIHAYLKDDIADIEKKYMEDN